MKNFLEISYCANVEGWKFLWLVLFLHAREGWIHEFWMNMQLASAFSKYVTHPQKFLFVIPAMVSEYVRFSAAGQVIFFFCSYMISATERFVGCCRLHTGSESVWMWFLWTSEDGHTFQSQGRIQCFLASLTWILKKKSPFLKMEEELLACE